MRHAVSQTVFRTRRIRRRDVSGAARETPRAPHSALNLAPYLALKFALTRAPGIKTISAKRQAPSAKRQAPSAKRQAPSAKRQAPSAKRQAPSAKRQAPSAKRQAPSAKRQAQAPSAKRQAPSAKRQAPSAKRQAPSAKRQAPSALIWPRRPSPLARAAGRAAASLPILSAAARGDFTVSTGFMRTTPCGPGLSPHRRTALSHAIPRPGSPPVRRGPRPVGQRPASIPDRRDFGRNPSGPATIIGENP